MASRAVPGWGSPRPISRARTSSCRRTACTSRKPRSTACPTPPSPTSGPARRSRRRPTRSSPLEEAEELAEIRLDLLRHPVGLWLTALVAHGGVVEPAVAAAVQIRRAVRTFRVARNRAVGRNLLAALEAEAHPSSAAEYCRVC